MQGLWEETDFNSVRANQQLQNFLESFAIALVTNLLH